MAKPKLRIIPLGGVGEIGKNMTVLEYGNSIIVVDCGVMFPEENMPGIDLVIPDIAYLQDRARKVKAFFITHGHEDHIGALPYVLPNFEVPVYATRLTMGLIEVKLREHKLLRSSDLRVTEFGRRIQAGPFDVEFFSVAHSVPDAAGLAIRTPIGTVVHTGDFKIDLTPVDSKPTDISALARLGTEGVQVLLADSTGVERPGYTPSESTVGRALDEIVRNAPGRVITATFASLIARIQQIVNVSAKYDRKVAVIGRSMQQNVKMALELGYLTDPGRAITPWEQVAHLPPERVSIITTGAQGEPTSALSRMANRDHRQIQIRRGDTVVLSASPIPGNEELVSRNIDNLFKLGANVIYGPEAHVHVSGHPGREELKMLTSITSPKYLVPVHGETRHLILHARLAEAIGVPAANILIPELGRVMEFTENSAGFNGHVPASNVFVDGVGVGEIGDVVLRDRRHLSQDGVVVAVITVDRRTGRSLVPPEIISRGFVDDQDEPILEGARKQLQRNLQQMHASAQAEPSYIQNRARDVLQRFLYERTKRRPMVLGLVVEV
ncbi:MAG TPA: ribonuclease J [Chloroflexota bacterium]|nr:ribonuclease J [Chloroflexota bacterium]